MFLNVNNHTLHVAVSGDPTAPALVLLHSLGTEAALWDVQVAQFSRSHRVICPEFRGHGLSEPSREPLTCEALAGDVMALLDALEVADFTLAGCSLGGVVAQLVAAQAGARVQGLAIFDSYIKAADPQMWRDRAAKIRADGLGSISAGVLGVWMSEAAQATPDGMGLAQMLARASDAGYADACDALAEADCSATTPSISCPTAIAYGSDDKAAPRSASEALVAVIAGARLIEIDGVAHLPMLHAAQACNDIIQSVLPRV